MERLQEAIEKARKVSQSQPQSARRNGSGTVEEVDARWAALQQVQLDNTTLTQNRIFTLEATRGAVSFDVLRTRTLRYMQQQGWTRLAITSPTPTCGKSTISLNLAFAVARQPKTRVIQIETDLRRPSQERLMALNARGASADRPDNLHGLFSGDTPFSELARRYGDRCAFATNRKGLSNASDLLLGNQVGSVLQDIEDSYQPDIMIFDMPPVLVNDDTLAFTRHVDCALIVAAAEHTTTSQIDKCEKELAGQTNILGVVLNKCRVASSDGVYGYDYGYES